MYARNPDGEKTIISLHRFADHPMTHLKDWRRGDCCGIKFETITDGYYCAKCKFFTHKTCSNPPSKMFPHLCSNARYREYMYLSYIDTRKYITKCDVCKGKMTGDIQNYKCYKCGLGVHLECAKYPPPEIIDVPRDHDHQLKLEMVESCFTCAACGKDGDGYPYKCHECDLTFHVNCEKYPAEVIHPFHPLHPLKLFKGEPPDYSGGTCRYCEEKLSNYQFFYHCSTCNFSLDQNCALNPPPQYLDDPNTHDHKLTLLPRLVSFTCNICGLSGDRSPYVCLQCNFMAHNTCQGFPWVIKTNRHDHCVSRTSLLGVVNSVCGVCRKKMDWSCGGYYCKRCPESTYHTKCATRHDVSDKREMKDVPEKDEDVEPFEVIDENTIRHFLHHAFGHYLRLDKSGIFIEERGSCKACAYPINHDSFYGCMGKNCDFIIHESCAKMPMQKQLLLRHGTFFLNQVTRHCSICEACGICYNGFNYTESGRGIDVRCASISEPFVHQSHPHPLFYTTPKGVCSACNKENNYVVKCVEDNCGYILDFKCALLPYEVKHRVDDHFLSLCYGENASGKYQCNICEKETDPRTWFYTCKDCDVTLHINCVLGDFRAIEAERKLTTWEQHSLTSMAVHNNTMPQPLCNQCKSCCVFPIILKVTEDKMPDKNYPKYYCSINCFDLKYIGTGCINVVVSKAYGEVKTKTSTHSRVVRPTTSSPSLESNSSNLYVANCGPAVGLFLVPEFVSVEEEQELLAVVDTRPWIGLAKWRVQHYGYEFCYGTRNVDTKKKLGELPSFVSTILERISLFPNLGNDPASLSLDQLTVNEYPSGVGLSPHIDTHSAFEDCIFSLSLAGPCIMEFRRYSVSTWKVASTTDAEKSSNSSCIKKALYLPPRSMLLLSGEARYAWNHYIPHHKIDKVKEKVIRRSPRRVSFTLRKVRNHPCRCE